ncbi:MAG: 3-phosphoshikimate 1-carboxyvinyltransferase [Cyclobacteriaceae bacterium]|nr:3-phosphoshikimate 1-carboxyvinyltransferase [Cyclobacteriaceae bacterium]
MKKEIHISYQKKSSDLGKVQIPGSKSESNRALLINALCVRSGEIKNLSSARDTQLMSSLINSSETEIDVMDAGTVMRFLTTYFALTNQQKVMTGTARMQERPIKLLVDALQTLGVLIEYLNKDGYPPHKIVRFNSQLSNSVSIDGSISSQYLSALLMLAPTLEKGLILNVKNGATSRPYLLMTIELMKHFGVEVEIEGHRYKVKPSTYTFKKFTVEPDWSSASYWYSIFALSGAEQLELTGYRADSLQGDSALAQLMLPFGVKTTFGENGALLTKQEAHLPASIDFINNPDLAQTFAVICAALEHSCVFTGLHTLKIKETDRVLAIQQELQKFGADFVEEGEKWTVVPPSGNWMETEVFINTYHDHRMAMAFAPLACIMPSVTIESPEVVNKSYPSFWADLEKVGFKIV